MILPGFGDHKKLIQVALFLSLVLHLGVAASPGVWAV